jgi:hypothetical protein
MKAEGRISKAPLSESFGRWRNLKVVLVALLGLTAGQAVIWYTGQFYALFFLTQTLQVDGVTASVMLALLTYLVILVAMVYGPLAACCPPWRLPSWRRPATCTTGCGTPSSWRV